MFAPSQLNDAGAGPQSRDFDAAADEAVAKIIAGCKTAVPDLVRDLMVVAFLAGALWYQGLELEELVRAAKTEGRA